MIRFIIPALLLGLSNFSLGADLCAPYKLKLNYNNENQRFEDFLNKDWDHTMKQSPEWGADLGYPELADKWTDLSLEAIAKRKKQVQCAKKGLESIKRAYLSEANKLNYDLFKYRLDLWIESLQFNSEYLPLNQLGGVHTDIIDVLMGMPKATAKDVENILKRLDTANIKVAQTKTLLEEGLKLGMTPPKLMLKKVPAQFDTILTSKPEDSALYAPFKDLPGHPSEKVEQWRAKAKSILSQKLLPSLQGFKNFLVEEYIPKARETISIQDLPNGKKWYEYNVKAMTTTNMKPEEIHELGLKEVERITVEMNKVREQVGFKKDLKAFNKHLLTDSKFYYKKAEDLIIGYRDIAKRADAELPRIFGTLPRLTYGVREIPAFKAEASPAAYYMSGSLQTGRAGYFEANTTDLKARPKWAMEALTLHEAVPGHHLQIALAQELGDMPKFRRYDGYTAYVEGWGLYSEKLGEDMGFYKDPYSKYGQLTYEMWRAVRLVVDTGIHFKGWSRDQALQYFNDNVAKGASEIEVEVDRYIVWPGQALGYKIGQLKFIELRKRATEELGDKFDIRKFHDVLLSGGSLPIDILEKRVVEWIGEMKGKRKKKK